MAAEAIGAGVGGYTRVGLLRRLHCSFQKPVVELWRLKLSIIKAGGSCGLSGE